MKLCNRITPHRIKHYPGVTLDVVLFSPDENTPTTGRNMDAVSASMEEEKDVESFQVAQLPEDTSSG